MTQISAWLGGGIGAAAVVLASALGTVRPAPAPAPAPTLQATLPAEQATPSRQRFAPACQAMLRGTGGCDPAAPGAGRLLRT